MDQQLVMSQERDYRYRASSAESVQLFEKLANNKDALIELEVGEQPVTLTFGPIKRVIEEDSYYLHKGKFGDGCSPRVRTRRESETGFHESWESIKGQRAQQYAVIKLNKQSVNGRQNVKSAKLLFSEPVWFDPWEVPEPRINMDAEAFILTDDRKFVPYDGAATIRQVLKHPGNGIRGIDPSDIGDKVAMKLDQQRVFRDVCVDGEPVCRISFDDVGVGNLPRFQIIEVEVLNNNGKDNKSIFAALDKWLQGEDRFAPESASKVDIARQELKKNQYTNLVSATLRDMQSCRVC